jgi:hypothetical protein
VPPSGATPTGGAVPPISPSTPIGGFRGWTPQNIQCWLAERPDHVNINHHLFVVTDKGAEAAEPTVVVCRTGDRLCKGDQLKVIRKGARDGILSASGLKQAEWSDEFEITEETVLETDYVKRVNQSQFVMDPQNYVQGTYPGVTWFVSVMRWPRDFGHLVAKPPSTWGSCDRDSDETRGHLSFRRKKQALLSCP